MMGGIYLKKGIIAFSLIIITIFTGCSGWKRSGYDRMELNSVGEVEITDVRQNNNVIYYTLVNGTDQSIWFGSKFEFERDRLGKWYKVKTVIDAEVTPELYHLPPNSQEEYQVHLEYWKNVKPGKYRIVKEFNLSQYNEIRKEEEPGNEYFFVSQVFEIVE